MPKNPDDRSQDVADATATVDLEELIASSPSRPDLPGAGATGPHGAPGTRPGIEHRAAAAVPPRPGDVTVTCVDYGPDRVETRELDDLDAFLAAGRPDWPAVRWINVHGLHPYVINRFRETFGFHTLAAEDVLNVPQRPKVESYPGALFVVARMLMRGESKLIAEQISFFVYDDTLITFQEQPGDVWSTIHARIDTAGSRLRTHGTGYLLYALLDAIVDHCFPILEQFGDTLEQLEAVVLDRPTPAVQRHIHGIKTQLVMLRRVIWPTREMVGSLYRDEHERLDEFVRTYLNDVYDHTVQLLDVIETYRDMTGSLTDLYLSSISNRMNEVMKVLTLMASFFIPITFLAGVYGMNFEHIPELSWHYSYGLFWLLTATIVTSLTVFFWRKGWIGRGPGRDDD